MYTNSLNIYQWAVEHNLVLSNHGVQVMEKSNPNPQNKPICFPMTIQVPASEGINVEISTVIGKDSVSVDGEVWDNPSKCEDINLSCSEGLNSPDN